MPEISATKVIVCESTLGWVLNPLASLRICNDQLELQNYETNSTSSRPYIYNCQSELFAIEGPYRMTSQYEKFSKSIPENVKKKKRKRKAELNDGEIALQKYYDKVQGVIGRAYDQLIALGKECDYFMKQGGESAPTAAERNEAHDHGNNAVARQAAAHTLQSSMYDVELSEWCTAAARHVPSAAQRTLRLTADACQQLPVNTLVCNDGDHFTMMEKNGQRFIIPPRASFLLSDISLIRMLGESLYDVIVLDPPWQNKSVKRQKTYNSLSVDDLLQQLPLHSLMSPGCVVAVWVTNKQAQQAFVRDTLFPAFGITLSAQWYWLKVTVRGEPVCDLHSLHKKPFESLLIGRLGGDPAPDLIPCDQVLVSVPCVLHSRKPPLHDILEKIHPKSKPRCLELFARNLLPGWTSWGNEVVKFQEEKYFVAEYPGGNPANSADPQQSHSAGQHE